MPDCCVMYLSVARPSQAYGMNEIRPSGVTATGYLRVL